MRGTGKDKMERGWEGKERTQGERDGGKGKRRKRRDGWREREKRRAGKKISYIFLCLVDQIDASSENHSVYQQMSLIVSTYTHHLE